MLDKNYLDKLRRYQVYYHNQCIYQVVTSIMDEVIILDTLEKRFKHLKYGFRIYKNKKLIKIVKFKRDTNLLKILDQETGEIYPDIYSFSDNFGININEAKTKIRKLHRFKYLK